ncbi:MAG: hemin uptake protein HemP [Burkholderiales bacterium]|nr:hemin uptake protein HemP [Burkholderiales bacterium]
MQQTATRTPAPSVTATTTAASAPTGTTSATPEISSASLLGEQGLLRIEHKGSFYTLRATSKGGLILTK